jgi:prolyl-tRNA editing enzyme YbaK/EbsC (Cys-tRNA(Pro) deacylase)
MRVTSPETALELTGYSPGGITPIGMKTNVPIYITKNISSLEPNVMYLGAGHVDWKVGVSIKEFCEKTGCGVIDLL